MGVIEKGHRRISSVREHAERFVFHVIHIFVLTQDVLIHKRLQISITHQFKSSVFATRPCLCWLLRSLGVSSTAISEASLNSASIELYFVCPIDKFRVTNLCLADPKYFVDESAFFSARLSYENRDGRCRHDSTDTLGFKRRFIELASLSLPWPRRTGQQ